MHKFLVVRGESQPPAPDALMPGLRHFRRHEVLASVPRAHAASAACRIGGVDELWLDTTSLHAPLDPLRRAYGNCALIQVSAVREQVIFERPALDGASAAHRLSLLQRTERLSRAAFSAYWEQVHAPLAACHRHVNRYVQNHVLDARGEDPGCFDGMAEFEITDLDGMASDYQTAAGMRMRADVANFAGTISTYMVRTEEWMASA